MTLAQAAQQMIDEIEHIARHADGTGTITLNLSQLKAQADKLKTALTASQASEQSAIQAALDLAAELNAKQT